MVARGAGGRGDRLGGQPDGRRDEDDRLLLVPREVEARSWKVDDLNRATPATLRGSGGHSHGRRASACGEAQQEAAEREAGFSPSLDPGRGGRTAPHVP